MANESERIERSGHNMTESEEASGPTDLVTSEVTSIEYTLTTIPWNKYMTLPELGGVDLFVVCETGIYRGHASARSIAHGKSPFCVVYNVVPSGGYTMQEHHDLLASVCEKHAFDNVDQFCSVINHDYGRRSDHLRVRHPSWGFRKVNFAWIWF
jgi:hypothetical protein